LIGQRLGFKRRSLSTSFSHSKILLRKSKMSHGKGPRGSVFEWPRNVQNKRINRAHYRYKGNEAENLQLFVAFVQQCSGIIFEIFYTLQGWCQIRPLDSKTNTTKTRKILSSTPPLLSRHLQCYLFFLCECKTLQLIFLPWLSKNSLGLSQLPWKMLCLLQANL